MATKYQNAMWAQDKKEAKQSLDFAKWQRDYQAGQLRQNATNNGLARGISRGSIVGGEIGQGMIPLDKNYSMAQQAYQNELARIKIAGMANSGGGGGGRRLPADPVVQNNPNAVASSPPIYGQTSSGAPVVGSNVPYQAAAMYTGTPYYRQTTPEPKQQTTQNNQYEWWNRNH